MNKKLILLMLALPLILMLSLFTATSTVSLVVKVSVSKVVINDPEVVYLDLEESYDISYTVYPTNAENKKVTFLSEGYGQNPATVNVEDGKVIPQTCGQAKITVTTVDGGYQDSFVVSITTNKLQSISSTLSTDKIKIGEKTQIITTFTPQSAQNNKMLVYEIIEGKDCVKVDQAGNIEGLKIGNATIKVSHLLNREVNSTVQIQVERTSPMEFATKTDTKRLSEWTGSVEILSDSSVVISKTELKVLDGEGKELNGVLSSYAIEDNAFKYTFDDQEEFIGVLVVELSVTVGEEVFKDYLTITRLSKIEAKWADENWGENEKIILLNPNGDTDNPKETLLEINLLPSNANVSYEVSVSNDLILCEMQGNSVYVKAVKAGATYKESYSIITLTITDLETNEQVVLTKEVNILIKEFLG
jgi:hypothetical protein